MNNAHAGAAPCLVIPPVRAFAMDDWEAADAIMKTGAKIELGQPWLPQRQTEFKPCQVWLATCGDELLVYSELDDDQPANRATQWNDATWMTGDVLEFFFQAEGRPGYYEFHVTPENCRLQLFFPSREAFLARRRHTHWAMAESRFDSAARVNDARTRWYVLMRVKLDLVLDGPRDDGSRRFKFLFSRYDYVPGNPAPVTSASAPLTRADFHNMGEWSWAEIASSGS